MRSFYIYFFILIGGSVSSLVLAGSPIISAGNMHSIALKVDGSVVAWGDNAQGQLGNGTNNDSSIPVAVSGLSNVIGISAGYNHNLAVKSDGTVVGWGVSQIVLGSETSTQNILKPVKIEGLTSIIAVSAGNSHSMALKSDGTVVSWGFNSLGELGNGTTGTVPKTPALVAGLSGVIAVSAGNKYSIALKSDGTVIIWGHNRFGQLGNGTTKNSLSPTAVPRLTGIIAISAGKSHSMALKSDGTVVTWGRHNGGQYGVDDFPKFSPGIVPGLTGVKAISAFRDHSMVQKHDGAVLSWGGEGHFKEVPTTITGLSEIAAVSSGGFHSIVLKADGTVLAWGSNSDGQLGDGTNQQRLDNPALVVGDLNLGKSTTSPVITPIFAISNDRVFAYAEANFPALFPGTAANNQYQQYTYRFYPKSKNYLGIDTSGVIYILGSYTQNKLTTIGSVVNYKNAILAWEAIK
ncbi:MAG: hypothetical protein KAH20_10305 [Methylococcales bacterium]|nr:hypothetical protein [Methylococcales bacterium]